MNKIVAVDITSTSAFTSTLPPLPASGWSWLTVDAWTGHNNF
jgi:hypothetical protein